MAIQRHGFNPADYADHLLTLSAVDTRLYQRLVGTSGDESIDLLAGAQLGDVTGVDNHARLGVEALDLDQHLLKAFARAAVREVCVADMDERQRRLADPAAEDDGRRRRDDGPP